MEAIMEPKPLGVYIRTLREHVKPKMTQRKLAETVGASSNTIHRIEVGAQEPQQFLAAILTAVGGRIKDVPKLQTPDATIALAEALAAEAITEQMLLSWANTDNRRMRLLQRIKKMSDDDPDLRARIEGYLDQLQGR